jgi:hypothetical protein
MFLPGSLQRQVKSPGVEDGRFGVWHGQQQGDASRQRRACPTVPVLLVGLAGFAQVDVWIDQSGNFYHRLIAWSKDGQKKRADVGSLIKTE